MKTPISFRLPGLNRFSGQKASTLLGLTLEGHRLEGVVVRRTNGSASVVRSFVCALSLDPLKDDPTLVGREIRKQLDAAGVRERRCIVGLPLHWALTLTTTLPDLPQADIASFLDIAAERGFPYSPGAFLLAHSKFQVASEPPSATIVAVPRDHVVHLEGALRAAQLRPVSFSFGITALQSSDATTEEGILSLLPCESGVGLQVGCGGGVALLRTIEDAFEVAAAERLPQMDHLIRELRITMGQLPAAIRQSIRRLQVFGNNSTARALIPQLEPRMSELGLRVEHVTQYAPGTFKFQVPANVEVSAALSLALQYLAGEKPTLEFLPPKVRKWQQFQSRYPAGKFAYAGAALGVVAVLAITAFVIQQWQLSHLEARWASMETDVAELESMQQEIQTYRPWFDESFRCLSILQRLSETFPEQGSVTAKSIEIRPNSVVCSGTATDSPALLHTLDQLRASTGVESVQVEGIRGKAPLQFTFNFQWTQEGQP